MKKFNKKMMKKEEKNTRVITWLKIECILVTLWLVKDSDNYMNL